MDKTNEVTENSILVLTPFGSPMGYVNYFMSLMQLRESCRDNDVKLNYFFEKNASLITHARNDMVNNFLLININPVATLSATNIPFSTFIPLSILSSVIIFI